MMKKLNLVIVGILIILFASVIGVNYARKMNRNSILKKYDIECFAGCKDISKCPMVRPYYTYTLDGIDNIKEKYNLSNTDFDNLKNKCKK